MTFLKNKKMIKEGICPHCNKQMEYENGEDGFTTVFYWECKCGRSYDLDGNDVTDYECTNIDR